MAPHSVRNFYFQYGGGALASVSWLWYVIMDFLKLQATGTFLAAEQ
jgi:hypothetical protein